MQFDCVILYGPNDTCIIDTTVNHARKHLIGLRDIYIISYDASYINTHATVIHESVYPFNINDFKVYIQLFLDYL